jgi:hypothetical protein
VETHDVFPAVALAVVSGDAPPAAPKSLWDGLEAFAAHGDEVEPAPLAAAATQALGVPPDASGLIDHQSIGDEWERARGQVSIIDRLIAGLAANR